MPGGSRPDPVSTAPAWVDASTPGATPVYGGKTGGILLGYQVPENYFQAQNIAAATAANLAAGPSAPGQIWVDQPSQADIAHGNAQLQAGHWANPGPSGILNQLAGMANDLKPIILAVASGGAFGPEGILASRIVNAGTAIQNGNVLGGLSQVAGIVKMPDAATALSVANALKNNDYASLALGAVKNTGIGSGLGSTEILPDLTVTGALNLASAVNGLNSKNPRTVITSIADLQDRAPDLFDSITSAVTGSGGGGGGLDTITDRADTVSGGPGDDFVTGGVSNDSVTSGGGLDTVEVSGSNGVPGTDAIDTILGNLDTTRSFGGTPTVLNEVTTTGSCPLGQVRNPLTGKCEDVSNILSGVTVTGTQGTGDGSTALDSVTTTGTRDTGGSTVLDSVDTTGTQDTVDGGTALDTVTVASTCPTGYTKNPVTGACELDILTVDELPPLPPATKICGINQHLDPLTNECVDNSALDTVTVTGTCPTGYTKNPVTGACELDVLTVDELPPLPPVSPLTPITPPVVTPPVSPQPPVVTPPVVPPVTPASTGALPTYTDPTGIPGKVFTLGKMGNLMKYDEGLKQLEVPTMQRWSDMADMALPAADVGKAASALAQYAPDAEKDIIPQFYAHGGAVQHFAEGGMPDVQAMLAAADKADVMDALKNLGNIGSEIKPANSRVLSLGQMGAPSQPKTLQQMTVIPQLAALLQSRGMKLAEGGQPDDHTHPEYDGNPVFRTGGLSGLGGKYVEGKGDGTSDDIAAMLANGEYVFSADVVSALGNGSNKAGAKELDQMVQAIRSRARSAPPDKLPPDAKSPLEYLKSSKGNKNG